MLQRMGITAVRPLLLPIETGEGEQMAEVPHRAAMVESDEEQQGTGRGGRQPHE